MANGLVGYWQQENLDGVLDRIELYKTTFTGFESIIEFTQSRGFTFEHEEVTSSSDSLLTIHANKIIMGTLEFTPYLNTDAKRTLIQTIADSEATAYKVVWKRDGVDYWQGYPTKRMLTSSEDKDYFATLQFKDFEILKGIEYPLSDTRVTLITTFAQIFKALNYLLPGSPGVYVGISTATALQSAGTTTSDDYLNQVYHDTYALRNYRDSGEESDTPISMYEALEHLAESGLIVFQIGGKFRIHQFVAFDDPSDVLISTYDDDGVQLTSAGTDIRDTGYTTLASGTPTLLVESEANSYPSLKQVETTFNHRSTASQIQINPSLIVSSDSTYNSPISTSGDETLFFSSELLGRMTVPFDVYRTILAVDTSTDVITITAHGLSNRVPIKFSGASLPGGIDTSTIYYVEYRTNDEFKIHTNTALTELVDITSSGTGTVLTLGSVSVPSSEYAITLGSYYYDEGASQFLQLNDINATTLIVDFSSTDVGLAGDEFTITGHGFKDGSIVRFLEIGGGLPSPFAEETDYYVVNATTNTFQFSLSYDGSVINIASVGTGAHKIQRITNLSTLSKYSATLSVVRYLGSINVDTSLPSGVVGEIELHLLPFRNLSTDLFDVSNYLESEFLVSDASTVGSSIKYVLTQSQAFPYKYTYPELWYGDGVYTYSRSSYRTSTSLNDITTGWRLRGDSTFEPFGKILLTMLLSLQRSRRVKYYAVIKGEYDPSKVLVYRSMNLAYAGGRYSGRWEPILMEINAETATDTYQELIQTNGESSSGSIASTQGISQAVADDRYLLESFNLSDLNDVATARENLGLGDLSVQDTINNDDWSGSDLEIVNGGTGASSASVARTNLGLEIGTDIQEYSNILTDIDDLAPFDDSTFLVGNGSTLVKESGATARTSLGLGTIATFDGNQDLETTDNVSFNRLDVNATTESTSHTTGALVVDGGLGVAKDIWANKNMYINGGLFAKELVVNTTRVQFDNLMTVGGGKIGSVSGLAGSETVVFVDEDNNPIVPVFEDDILHIQRVTGFTSGTIVKNIWRAVQSVTGNDVLLTTAGITWTTGDDVGSIVVGDDAVAQGNLAYASRDHYIKFDLSDANSPAIRVLNSVTDVDDDGDEVITIGNLTGKYGFVSEIFGFGAGDPTLVGNHIYFTPTSSKIKVDEFELEAGNLLINSGTDALTGYTPDDITSTVISNNTFSTNLTGWTVSGSITPTWNATNSGSCLLALDNTASSFFRITQEYAGIETYIGKTLSFKFDLAKGIMTNSWVAGSFDVRIECKSDKTAGGWVTAIEKTITPSDLVDVSAGSTVIELTTYIRADWTDVRYVVDAPTQDLSAQSNDQYIYFLSLEADLYDSSQVTVNSNGISIYRSPVEQITFDDAEQIIKGSSMQVEELILPVIADRRIMTTPEVGYVNVAVDSNYRIQLLDATGTFHEIS